LAPLDADWFYNKAAAVCRKIYLNKTNTLGIQTLKAMFGKKKRGSVKSPKFTHAGGKVLREVVKQLKAAKYISNKFSVKDGETHSVGLHLTPLGITELDKVASKIIKSRQ
jgi:ribosomal protein S19E (S16A)